MEYKKLVGEFICLEEDTGNLVIERVGRIQSVKKSENGCTIWWGKNEDRQEYLTSFENVKRVLLGVPFVEY